MVLVDMPASPPVVDGVSRRNTHALGAETGCGAGTDGIGAARHAPSRPLTFGSAPTPSRSSFGRLVSTPSCNGQPEPVGTVWWVTPKTSRKAAESTGQLDAYRAKRNPQKTPE